MTDLLRTHYAVMSALSPEAEKAQREGAGRARGWNPWLMRTATKAIVIRPRLGGRRYRRAFADWMAANLPGFVFNRKRNWWEADLSELSTAHETLQPDGVNVSDGAKEHLAQHEGRAS